MYRTQKQYSPIGCNWGWVVMKFRVAWLLCGNWGRVVMKFRVAWLLCGVSGGYGPVPGYGHAGDAFVGPSMGGPTQQYRGMNYPASYPSSSGGMEPHQAGHFAGAGTSMPGLGTSVSSDAGGMPAVSVGRAGSTSSEDQVSASRSAQPSEVVSMNTQQTASSDGSQDNSIPATMEGNHVRMAGPPSVDDLGRQHPGLDGRPMYPAGTDGTSLRYGQPGMDMRGGPQKQMFGQMPSRSAPFMNMNGVAIRPGQLPFGPDGTQGRGVEGMGAPSSEMDNMLSRSDQPQVGQDGLQRRPVQAMPADSMFSRQGPPPFGMDGRLGPPSGMDPMMRRASHPVQDDGTMNRSGQSANIDSRASMHGMPVRADEPSDDSFRQGPQLGPGNMPIRPGMENMPVRPLTQMGGMAEGMNVRPMQPQHPQQGGMDVMQGRPGLMRMDGMERRAGIPEGVGPHSQHPGYSHQYPGYGGHQASSHPGHGPPQSGFPPSDANASGDQMFRNHLPPHAMHTDSRGPVPPGSGSDSFRTGSEFAGDQRHFMANGDVDMIRRAGDTSFPPKNFENGECLF